MLIYCIGKIEDFPYSINKLRNNPQKKILKNFFASEQRSWTLQQKWTLTIYKSPLLFCINK